MNPDILIFHLQLYSMQADDDNDISDAFHTHLMETRQKIRNGMNIWHTYVISTMPGLL